MTEPEQDLLGKLAQQVGELHAALLGNLSSPGGLFGRVSVLEAEVAKLKGWRSWFVNLGTAVLTALATAGAVGVLFGKHIK